MNRSILRSIKPMKDIGKLKQQYRTTPGPLVGMKMRNDFPGPFSLLNHYHILGRFWTNYGHENCHVLVLGPGIILLKNYINIQGQAGIVDICEKQGGFYKPCNRYGQDLRFHMTCFGQNWEPITRYRRHAMPDGSQPPQLPGELIHLAKTAIKHARLYLHELPTMCPDVCVAKFYGCDGRLGLHQDGDESRDSLRKGLPVVSISVGYTAEFWYGYTRDANQLNRVLLESGDVFIFGGKSRRIFHGVEKIIPGTFSGPLVQASKIRPGRLNLTLKQF